MPLRADISRFLDIHALRAAGVSTLISVAFGSLVDALVLGRDRYGR